jgi:DNA-binding CsgD family transcriptional regulator
MCELTPKEFETLIYIVEGRRNKDIAKSLGVGYKTTEAHVSSILGKTNCDSRASLISRYFTDKENFVVKVKQTKRGQIMKLLVEDEKKLSQSAIARKLNTTAGYVSTVKRDMKITISRSCDRPNFNAPI